MGRQRKCVQHGKSSSSCEGERKSAETLTTTGTRSGRKRKTTNMATIPGKMVAKEGGRLEVDEGQAIQVEVPLKLTE